MKFLGFFIASLIVPVSMADTQPAPIPAVSDDAVIATIGDRQVTVGDFVGYYQKRMEQSQPENRPSLATPADAQQMLENILNARAILISAESDGYDQHDEFIKAYTEFRDETLLDEIITRREQDLTVTSAEVEDYYQQSHQEYHVSLILLYDEKEARDLMPKLRQPGTDFAALALQYSRDPSSNTNGGKVAEAVKYSPQEPWITLFKLSKGEISDPLYIPSAYAWGIFRVDNISETTNLPPLDKVKDQLIDQQLTIKQDQVQEQIRNEALGKAKITRDEALLNLLFSGDVAEWDKPGMTEKTVSSVDVHTIAFGELLKFIRANFRDPAQTRSTDPALFRQLLLIHLGQLEKEQAVVSMCLAQGLDKEPAVAAKLGQFRDKELVMEYLRDNVESKIPKPSEQQIADYYEAHKNDADFQVPERLNATMLFSDVKSRLEEARTRIIAGEDMKTVMDDINARVMGEPGFKIPSGVNPELYKPIFLTIQTIDSDNKGTLELYAALRAQQPGVWGEVFPMYEMEYLARLEVVHPPHVKPLKDASKQIIARLEEQIQTDPATNQMLWETLVGIRNRYPAKVDSDKLELARQKALVKVSLQSSEAE
jgi:parvulin-like peptidyl-prolyl isomerase